jgi:ATP synthase protein I
MVTEADRARLEALEKRIAMAKQAVDPPRSATEEQYTQAQLAWRMVVEMVAGLAIGFGIGYGLDHVFGTMPLFLVLFILAGLAAGVKTVLRTAREVEMRRTAEAVQQGDDGRGD